MRRFFKKKEVPSGNFRHRMFLILSLTLIFLSSSTLIYASGSIFDNENATPEIKPVAIGEALYSTVLVPDSLSSQPSKTISGTVKDAKGLAIPGATIVVKGTTTGVNTSIDGIFSLK